MVNPYSKNTVKMWSPDWSIFKCRKRFSTLICQFFFANIVKIWSTKWSILTCLICIVKIWFTKCSILACLICIMICGDLVHQVVNSYFSNIAKIWSTKWSILTCLICIVKIWFTKSSILTCLILWRSSPPSGQFLLV